ncbi:pirin family protein [Stackebrandtia soli]|uniref:pirin family protein n=1 Tax=Stackebrandtia soli TaxID=1892856 RepID=UPI0039EA8308
MSNLDLTPPLRDCGGRGDIDAEPVRDVIRGREVMLGESTKVRRLLPTLGRRMVGAWCFIDHYGPDEIVNEPGMQVPPHPHTGLQTVSWLRQGEILHRDSLGSRQVLRPGQLGLMTSGHGISHAEQSPAPHPDLLHGAQLWVALPQDHRDTAPTWEFHGELPTVTATGLRGSVILGSIDGAQSRGTTYTPIVGAQLDLDGGAVAALPLERDFEYAAVALSGGTSVDGVRLDPGDLLYLGCGRTELPLEATDGDTELLLLGGEPFDEKIVMWWNFIGRSGDDVRRYRDEWMTGDRFGTVDYEGDRLDAPPVPDLPLKARGRER